MIAIDIIPAPIVLPTDDAARAAGFTYDATKAEAAVKWVEDVLGVMLYSWQKNILLTYFGWRGFNGQYRFEKLSIWLPKKNGKSWIISVLLAYKLFELKNASLFSVAYNSKQAAIVLDGVISLFNRSPQIRKLIARGKIKCFSSPYRREIQNLVNGTRYTALADSINAADGLRGAVLVVDELHRMKNALYDVCAGMTTNMPGALEVIISTAGDGDRTKRGWQKYQYAKSVLAGETLDIRLLPVVFEAAGDLKTADEIYSLDRLIACNPVLQEDPAKLERAKSELAEARILRNDLNWRRLHLNQWVQIDGEVYIPTDVYSTAEVQPIPDEKLAGLPCYVGFDRSGGASDFTALTLLFDLGDGRLYERHFTFAQADRIQAIGEADDTDYVRYVESGELILIPGEVVADQFLADWIVYRLKSFNVKCFSADPYQAAFVIESVAATGIKTVHINQSNNAMLGPIISDYRDRARKGRIVHPHNGLVVWQHSQARVISTAKDAQKLVKGGSNYRGQGGRGHIDNLDSTINALAIVRADELENVKRAAGAGEIVVG